MLMMSLPAVLDGLGGERGHVLVVSGSEKGIHANSLRIHVFKFLYISIKCPILMQDVMGLYNVLLFR